MAVAFDAVSAFQQTGAATVSWSHTCTGSNRYLVVVVQLIGVNTVSGITYNGVALSQVKRQASTTNSGLEVWGLIAPATGANTVAVTLNSTGCYGLGSVSFTGVNQSTPTGTIASASASGGNPTALAVSGTATGLFLTTVGGNCGASGVTLSCTTTSATSRIDGQNDIGGHEHLGVVTVPGASSISDSWSWSAGVDWAQIGVPLAAAAAAAGPPAGSLALLGVGN